MYTRYKGRKQLLQPFKTSPKSEPRSIETGLDGLRFAILRQAVEDYTKALREDDEKVIHEVERFFLGDWGQLLSEDNGELIIDICKRKVANGAS